MNCHNVKIEKYTLLDYIITVKDRKITASEFIYFHKENIIREILHPAEIDNSRQVLVIKKYSIKGKDTGFSINEFTGLYADLPKWDKTKYFQIYDNAGNEKYLSRINILIKQTRRMQQA